MSRRASDLGVPAGPLYIEPMTSRLPERSSRRWRTAPVVAAIALTSWSCGGGTEPEVRSLTISPEAGLVAGVTGRQRYLLTATGDSGVEIDVDAAEWSIGDASVATVDEDGVVRGVSMGSTTVHARLGGAEVSATVEVWRPPVVSDYQVGVSYFGRGEYVEYIPGELPIVLSAPHGGALEPAEIAERSYGVTVTDTNTRELTLAVRDALLDLTGYAPHVVISHLDRTRLDPNREVEEAAQDNPFAEHAWTEYHGWIERARSRVAVRGGGLYIDMHGHGHPADRLELGYLLSSDQLNRPDADLNGIPVIRMTSIREMGRVTPLPFSSLLRGPTSFGGFLEREGVDAVPSPSVPMPGSAPYFTGGYSTRRHGSLGDTEVVSGLQIEHHYPGLRDTDANRRDYAGRLAVVIRDYMLEHFGFFEP